MSSVPTAEIIRSAESVIESAEVRGNPEILLYLKEKIELAEFELRDFARVVEEEEALSERVITLANSAWYGSRRHIDNVEVAVVELGAAPFYDLVLCSFLRLGLRIPPGQRMRFWEHCEMTGQVCRQIAHHVSSQDADNAFTIGLFHDCGVPLMSNQFEDYEGYMDAALSGQAAADDRENEIFGCNHSVIGSVLVRRWKLPPPVAEAMVWHHAEELPSEVTDEAQRLWALLTFTKGCVQSWTGEDPKASRSPMAPGTPLAAGICTALGIDEDRLHAVANEVLELLKLRVQSM